MVICIKDNRVCIYNLVCYLFEMVGIYGFREN